MRKLILLIFCFFLIINLTGALDNRQSVFLKTTSSSNPSFIGEPVTFTVTATPTNNENHPVVGWVEFYQALEGDVNAKPWGDFIGKSEMNNGIASFTTSSLPSGTNRIIIGFECSDGYYYGQPSVDTKWYFQQVIPEPTAVRTRCVSLITTADPTSPCDNIIVNVEIKPLDRTDTRIVTGDIKAIEANLGTDGTKAGGYQSEWISLVDGKAKVIIPHFEPGLHNIVIAYYGNWDFTQDTWIIGTYNAFQNTDVEIPEFPSVAVPVAAVLGLVAIIGRKKK